MATRLSIAKPDIVKRFDELDSPVLRQTDIGRILEENRKFWRLAESTRLTGFIKYLEESAKLRKVRIALPHRAETLYHWGEVSLYLLAASAKPGAYVSHYTAMHLHQLTDQVPEMIYANHEQRPIVSTLPPLSQQSIASAFRRPQRITKNIAPLGDRQLCLVNGKFTGRLGIVQLKDEHGHAFDVTGVERTLIDIAVRPYYSGGVSEVLEAFRRASTTVSLNKLAAMLKKMAFVYPYEQAIGFYLEHSGAYSPDRLELFRTKPFELDFYLTYAMKSPEYSDRWRLFFPKGL